MTIYETLTHVRTHIPARGAFQIVEPVGTGCRRLPVSGTHETPVIAWLIDSVQNDFGDRVVEDTTVTPVGPSGVPTGPYLLQEGRRFTTPDGSEVDGEDVHKFFESLIECELRS